MGAARSTRNMPKQDSSTASVPALGHQACQVWWARPADVRPALDRLLDHAELDRRQRLVNSDDRDRLTVGAALTRLVLARHLDRSADQLRLDRTCLDCGRQHGRPRLPAGDDGGGVRFSVSHSGDWIAVAVVRDALVGVDVERVSPGLEVDGVAAQALAEDEREALDRLPPWDRRRGLLAYWTRKEALLKATGDGLRVPMNLVVVSGPDEPPVLRRWSGPSELPTPVVLHTLRRPAGHVASLAVLGLPSVQVRELDATRLLAAPP